MSGGFANSNGIVFSSGSSNNVPQSISNYPYSQPDQNNPNLASSQLALAQQPIGINNALDFESIYSPVSAQFSSVSQSAQLQQKPEKPQSPYSSGGLTFAPLAGVPSPFMNQPAINSTPNNQINNQFYPSVVTSKPMAAPAYANFIPMKARPKCGISKYTNLRIVGGAITQIGTI